MSVLDRFKLTGQTALVTGARRGIGLGIAVALAEAGANIIAVSASLESAGSDIEKEVTALGRSFKGYRCDFSKRRDVTDFTAQVLNENPHIDILVNNAGTIRRKPAAEHDDALWDEVIETNLSSQFVLTREIGRSMIERGSGKIIFTASLLTYQGGITVPGYSASKGGVGQLTKSFANEWARKGVNVNAIAPGYVDTDNTEALRNDSVRSKSILERIPAGRWGTPADFGGAAVFLASSASDYVHGEILTVDGGWMGR
ncbi:2-deoxy-D-gluconate 3-dehydrogenase [Roseibium sp. TrichSKD4]|uniref:SDR family oxidoreductase n=1 Tax=Roseibium sp. TrichSKD4 TaxID=744980 RepID=UPI0001E56FA9|nr:SDR family oxidoreductase [Roseibium sp. TrichSKD4]EFO32087.1 2-deoxy-D-gluconate 3-dehydrogenase [Roseibium sp. TrichSKD4]